MFETDETCGVPVYPEFIIFLAISAAAGVWVFLDYSARTDGAVWERVAWLLGTLVALPIFLPIYLIAARPVGEVIRCPSCGRPTLAHRASCRHCGNAIEFQPAPRTWGLSELVGISLVFILTEPIIAAALGFQSIPSLLELSGFTLVSNLAFVGLSLFVVRVRYRLSAETLGIRFERWPIWAVGGLLIGAMSIPVSTQVEELSLALIAAVIGRSRAEQMAEDEHNNNVLSAILSEPLSNVELSWILFLICVVVPIGEEVFFRGFILGALRRWGVGLAVVLSAVFFSAVHRQIVHFLPIFVLGIVLAVAYLRTGSLVAAVLIHSVNNVVAIFSMLYDWNI